MENPFTPSFGEIPPYMAGRKQILSDLTRAFESERRNPSLTTLFAGARGTGKTALLSLAASEAESRGWITANVSALPGMLDDIWERAAEAAESFVEKEGTRITGIGIGQFFNVEWENEPVASGNWRTRMNRLFKQLEPLGIGLLITVDELRPDLDEMILLAATYQHFVRENKRVALLMAGLPHNVSSLLQDKTASFLRRARQHDLGAIPSADVENALRKTIADTNRFIGKEALGRALDAIGGFPYMLQLVGYWAWEQNPRCEEVTEDDVAVGVDLAKREFKDHVLKATYRGLSAKDRDFVQAMLPDGEVSSMIDIAARMGVSSVYAAQYRNRLLEQGVVGIRGRGLVGFEVPFFREYVAEQVQI